MASSAIKTAQSKEVINISQDFMTPSSKDSQTLATRPVYSDEIIQGSQKPVNQRSPGQPSNEPDELYSLSPHAQKVYDERRASAAFSEGVSHGNLESTESQPVLVVEDSLRDQAGGKSTSCFAPRPDSTKSADIIKAAPAKKTAASSSSTRTSNKPNVAAGGSKKNNSNGRPLGGALAALRAKKAETGATPSIEDAADARTSGVDAESPVNHAEASSTKTKQTPANPPQTKTSGKLPTRKDAPRLSEAAKSKTVAKLPLSSKASTAGTGNTRNTAPEPKASKEQEKPKPGPGALRRPAKKAKKQLENDVSVYNVPSSPSDDVQEPITSAKGATKRKRGRPPIASKNTKTTVAKGRKPGAAKAPGKPNANKSDAKSEKTNRATYKPLSVKERMLSSRDSKQVAEPAEAPKRKQEPSHSKVDHEDAEVADDSTHVVAEPEVTGQPASDPVENIEHNTKESTVFPAVPEESHRQSRSRISLPSKAGDDLRSLDLETPTTLKYPPYLAPTSHARRALVDLSTNRKSNIISWDKSGPRNQGELSPERALMNSERAYQSRNAHPLEQIHVGDKNDAISERTSIVTRPRSSFRPNAPSIAVDATPNVQDVLASFMKRPTKSLKQDQLATSTKPTLSSPPSSKAEPAPDFIDLSDDYGFQDIDTLERPSPSVAEQGAGSEKESPRSLDLSKDLSLAMPPPPRFVSARERPRKDPKEPRKSTRTSMPTLPERNANGKRPAQPTDADKKSKVKRIRKDLPVFSEHELEALNSKRPLLNIPSLPPDASRSKVSRVPSVDRLGSPVPRGMVLDDQRTVLEAFSQQNERATSSEGDEEVNANDMNGPEVVQNGTSEIGKDGSPGSGSSQSEPVIQDEPMSDVVGRERVAVKDLPKRPLAVSTGHTQAKTAREEPKETISSSPFKQQLDDMTNAMKKQQFALRPAPEHNDPDKTLVNSEPRPPKGKRLPSYNTVSSDISEESTSADSQMREILEWREGLQAHQLGLFDELVKISHRLVQHLVDQENVADNVADSYHRRGLALIEKMESTHGKQYADETRRLDQQKQRLVGDLKTCSNKLDAILRGVSSAQKSEAEYEADGGSGFEGLLRNVIEKFC